MKKTPDCSGVLFWVCGGFQRSTRSTRGPRSGRSTPTTRSPRSQRPPAARTVHARPRAVCGTSANTTNQRPRLRPRNLLPNHPQGQHEVVQVSFLPIVISPYVKNQKPKVITLRATHWFFSEPARHPVLSVTKF